MRKGRRGYDTMTTSIEIAGRNVFEPSGADDFDAVLREQVMLHSFYPTDAVFACVGLHHLAMKVHCAWWDRLVLGSIDL